MSDVQNATHCTKHSSSSNFVRQSHVIKESIPETVRVRQSTLDYSISTIGRSCLLQGPDRSAPFADCREVHQINYITTRRLVPTLNACRLPVRLTLEEDEARC